MSSWTIFTYVYIVRDIHILLQFQIIYYLQLYYYFTADLNYISSLYVEFHDKEYNYKQKQTNKLPGLSPQANYTERATGVCRLS
jgi:hypothetical protein